MIKDAKFVKSSDSLSVCPETNLPEFAFIGRSNVGKSSLINMLAGNKKLAKTSSTPGKTQLINHFIIDDEWYLVDLPGYGYAKASKTSREKWEKMIHNYLSKRENLACVFLLIDIRIKPQQNDLDFANMLGEMGIPFVILYTKSDKINQKTVSDNKSLFENAMLESWEAMPTNITTSALKKTGKEKVLNLIGETIEKWEKNEV